MGTGHKWYTKEAEQYLKDNWGSLHPLQIRGTINKMLGDNKSFQNISDKAQRMGLMTIKDAYNLITITDVARAFNVSNNTLIKGKLPHRPFRKGSLYKVVNVKEFWKWAYKNQERLDFTKYEKGLLLPEPAWLEEVKGKTKERGYHVWTEAEESALALYLANGKTSKYIARKLVVEESVVKSKIKYMRKFKAADLQRKYIITTEEQKNEMLELRAEGLTLRAIAVKMGVHFSRVQRICAKEKREQGAKDD